MPDVIYAAMENPHAVSHTCAITEFERLQLMKSSEALSQEYLKLSDTQHRIADSVERNPDRFGVDASLAFSSPLPSCKRLREMAEKHRELGLHYRNRRLYFLGLAVE